MSKSAPATGAVARVLACAFFAASHVAVRHVTQTVHPYETAFFRHLFGLALLVVPLTAQGWRATLATGRLPLHAGRAALNTAAMFALFHALKITGVAVVQALSFTAPLFACALAVVLLREPITARRVVALATGFGGVLLAVGPDPGAVDAGALLTLASAAAWAGVLLAMKSLARTDSVLTITAWTGLLMSAMTLPFALATWTWPTTHELAVLAGIGASATVGQMLMTHALKRADATAVLPFDFTRLVWAAALAWVVLDEKPDAATLLGACVIFAGALGVATERARGAHDARAPHEARRRTPQPLNTDRLSTRKKQSRLHPDRGERP